MYYTKFNRSRCFCIWARSTNSSSCPKYI